MTSPHTGTEPFVGRTAPQQAFAATLSELAPARRGLFGKAPVSQQHPRVFLIHGSGGLGKSALLRRLAAAAGAHDPAIDWVLLNWDDEHDAVRLPDSFPALLVRLHNALADHFDRDARQAFKDFSATHERHGQVAAKVASEGAAAYQEFATAAGQAITTIAGPAVSTALGLPPVPGVDKLLEAAIGFGVHLGADQVARFGQVLKGRLQQALSTEEYQLYTDPNDAYARSFVAGLAALADDRPLILAQDTYEWISGRPALESQFRALVVKRAVAETGRLAFVIAGRADLGPDYRRTFQAEPHRLRVDGLLPFTAEETRALLDQQGWPAAQADLVQRKTQGVPLALVTLLGLGPAAGGAPAPADLADPERESDAIEQTTERFLRYLAPTPLDPPETAQQKNRDRQDLYTLALQRTDDVTAQATAWGRLEGGEPLALAAVQARRQALQARNDFLFERGRTALQKEVRHFLRARLRQLIRGGDRSPEAALVRALNDAVLAHYRAALAEHEAALAAPDERLDDAQWRALCLDELNHLFWRDDREGLRALACRLLEAGNVQSPYLGQLVEVAAEAGTEAPELLPPLRAGTQTLLADPPDLKLVLAMWDAVGQRWPEDRLPTPYPSLLAYHRGRVLIAAGDTEAGVQALLHGLRRLPAEAEPPGPLAEQRRALRRRLAAALTGAAAVLALQQRDYARAITVAEQAIAADPDHPPAHGIHLIALMGQKAYARAHALLDELIPRWPDVMDFRWMRQTLYNVEGREAEARQELIRLATERPDFVEGLMKAIEAQSKDPETWQATTAWGADAGWSTQQAATFNRLRAALPPETLAEVVGAQIRLMAQPDPTPAQVLALRELAARHLPDWPDVQVELGLGYLAAERWPEAQAAFARAQALAPENALLYVVPARALTGLGRHAEALPHIRACVRLMPDQFGPAVMLVECLTLLGQLPKALAVARDALQRFPEVSLVRLAYSQTLAEAGQPAEAEAVLRAAYHADPNFLDLYQQVLRSMPPWAVDNLKQKLRLQFQGDAGEVLAGLPPEDMFRLHTQLLRARLEAVPPAEINMDRLAPVLDELIAARPGSAELLTERAHLFELAGDLPASIALLEGALERVPPEAQDSVRHALTFLLYRADEPARALAHQGQVAGPLNAAQLRLKAQLLAELGDYTVAVDAYDQALALEPDPDAARLTRFGLNNRAVGRLARAEELLRQALAQAPEEAFALYLLGRVLYQQDRFAEALEQAEAAARLSPDDAPLLASLAQITAAMGQVDPSAAYRQQALSALSAEPSYAQAHTLALLGLNDEALAHLQDLLRDNAALRRWALHDPDLRHLRGEIEALTQQT